MATLLPFQIRPLEPRDESALEVLLKDREYPTSAFASAEEMKSMALDSYSQTFSSLFVEDGLFTLVATLKDRLLGYVMGRVNQEETITREPQTQILDLYCVSSAVFQALLEDACEIARKAQDHYLVYHTYESQKQEKEWAEQAGMKTELLRTYMTVQKGESFPAHPDFKLRKAQSHELLFIMRVVAEHSPAYIPAHRAIDREQIQSWFVESYSSLSASDKKKVPLVLERISTGDLTGYMILQPGRMFGNRGPVSMYLYDIAVGPRGQGLGLSKWMALGSKQLMADMGGGFLYGDVSPENRLALSATLALGSRVDSRRWGIPLSSPGGEP